MREPCLNRAYVDPVVRLVERPDPDAGKKKWVRGPEELEGPGPISAVPLQAVGATGVDPFGYAGAGATGPASKVSRVPAAPQEVSSSTSSSAALLAVAIRAGVAEVVASSFGVRK